MPERNGRMMHGYQRGALARFELAPGPIDRTRLESSGEGTRHPAVEQQELEVTDESRLVHLTVDLCVPVAPCVEERTERLLVVAVSGAVEDGRTEGEGGVQPHELVERRDVVARLGDVARDQH